MRLPFVLTSALAAASLSPAQSNAIAGLDARLIEIEHPTYYGRRGPAYPDGEAGIAYSYYLCNTGSVQIPWAGPFNGPQPMRTDHPMFAFLVTRESDGRLVQITDTRTFVKHATSSANSSSYCGGACQHPGTSAIIGVGCGDAYSANTNSNRFWLAPYDEIDPWLGAWDPIGSYFDRGDPEVASPLDTDGVRSLTSGLFDDPVKNRVTLKEADLIAPGTFHYFMFALFQSEPAASRHDNIGYRQMTPAWDGTVWTFADGPTYFFGSILESWSGASVTHAHNGEDDGHFFVAVKVTEPSPGLWHYEYAIHNLDNARGAASLRIPVCPTTAIQNHGFRDIDGDPLNDWSMSRVGDEIMFHAPLGNPLNWNQIFNFWFDCDAAPIEGAVAIDQALPGPGALSVAVQSQIPAGVAEVQDLGPGCGNPPPVVAANGVPSMPNPQFGLSITATPQAGLFVFVSLDPASVPLGAGCTRYLHEATLLTWGWLPADNAGMATVPLPIPTILDLDGLPLHWQVVEEVIGGPLFGRFALSNGLLTVIGAR